MDPTVISLCSLAAMLLLMALGVPIGFSMGLTGVIGTALLRGPQTGLSVIGFMGYDTTASFSLAVVPLFILMGYFVMYSGSSDALFDAATKWFAWLPGGLAVGAIVGCAIFASACGSTMATALSIGKVAIPQMNKHGYGKAFSSACLAAGGTLGVLIPPSIPMVIYGHLTGASIGKLLVAGFVPGIIGAIAYSVVVVAKCKLTSASAPPGVSFPWRDRFVALGGVWGILIICGVVIGSIYAGVATPTEAGALGCAAALALLIIKQRKLRSGVAISLSATAQSTASIFILLVGAFLYSRFLGLAGLPLQMSQWIATAGLSPIVLLIVVVALFIFLGMFIDPVSMQVLAVPLVFPAIQAAGFDPIWFGVIVIRLVEIACLTPPLGLNVFVIGSISPDVSVHAIYREVTPFIAVDALTIALFTVFPQIIMFVPNMMR